MTFEEWVDEFKPIVNPFSSDPEETRFETHGEEREFVLNQHPCNTWTEVDAEGRFTTVIEGFHYVNRLGYYVTEKPWEQGTTYDIRDPELEKLR
jgi:hypothetical protein